MKRRSLLHFTTAAMIAALYVVFTLISSAMGLSSGVIQLRFSEAFTILPIFFPSAVWGLFGGCILANLLSGAALWDIVIGSLATLFGAIGTYYLRKKPLLAFLPPVFFNTVMIPPLLYFVYGFRESGLFFIFFTVFLGEAISVWLFGSILYRAVYTRFQKKTR